MTGSDAVLPAVALDLASCLIQPLWSMPPIGNLAATCLSDRGRKVYRTRLLIQLPVLALHWPA